MKLEISPFSFLRYVTVAVAIVSCAGCATPAPAVLEPPKVTSWVKYSTRIDDHLVVEYQFPANISDFSPSRFPLREFRRKKNWNSETLGGFSYPSGMFDRRLASTIYWVSIEPTLESAPPATATELSFLEFVRQEEEQKRANVIASGANPRGMPISPTLQPLVVRDVVWVCGRRIPNSWESELVLELLCYRRFDDAALIEVTAHFSRAVPLNSEVATAVRRRLTEVMERITVSEADRSAPTNNVSR